MGFVDAVKSFYGRYVDFAGRSSRSEFWWAMLFITIGTFLLMIPFFGGMMSAAVDNPSDPLAVYGPMLSMAGLPYLLFSLANLIPGISLAVRRLHDGNKSGWWYLAVIVGMLIPILNIVAVIGWIIYNCRRGTVGPNRFGPDPIGDSIEETFS